MRRYRFLKKISFVACSGIILVTACDRDSKSVSEDTATASAGAGRTLPSPVRNTGWDANAAGEFIIVEVADNPIEGALVLPEETDSTLSAAQALGINKFEHSSVDLFSPGGAAGSSSIAINGQQPPAEGCVIWPGVRLSVKPSLPWKVGFAAGHAVAVQIDSLEKLSSTDSSGITAEFAKQASTLSVNDDPAYRGLPFVTEKAYRLSFGDTTVLVGSVTRKINEEANPREEHLLLVLEKTGASGGDYSVAFQSRSAGSEDVVRTNSILAAVRFTRTNRVAVVVSFEYDDGGQLALLQRVGPRSWKITWRSAYTGC